MLHYKKVITFLFVVLCIVTGCGNENASSSLNRVSDNSDYALDFDKTLIEGMKSMSNKDNSNDLYSRTYLTHVEYPVNVGMTATLIKSYSIKSGMLLEYWVHNQDTSYYDYIFFGEDGKQLKITAGSDFAGSIYGVVLGSDTFLMGDWTESDADSNAVIIYEADKNFRKNRGISINLNQLKANVNYISEAYEGVDGNIYCIAYGLNAEGLFVNKTYCVFSNAGELLYEYYGEEKKAFNLYQTYDGKIGVRLIEKLADSDSQLTSFLYVNPVTGEYIESPQILWYDPQNINDIWSNNSIMTEDGQMLFGADSGIYMLNLETRERTCLYKFSAHGIKADWISNIGLVDGDICVVYKNSDEGNFIRLTHTSEEVELITIHIAATKNNAEKLNEAAIIFNRMYPAYHVEIEEDPDETSFLTKLGAGDGPVIIDSNLIGFQQQEKLWQPLGGVLEQLGITEELIPQAMEYGKINGILYGIPLDFCVDTMVINENTFSKWNYEEFLDYLEERTDIRAIKNNDDYGDDASIVLACFVHGMDDNYLFSADGSTIFNQKSFERLLNDIKSPYNTSEELIWGTSLTNNEVLYNRVSLGTPRDVTMCRMVLGENINYVGYPNNTGAGHYAFSNNLLCIRRNATVQEKQVALAFINILLSYDCQYEVSKKSFAAFSVRRDVLKEQFMSLSKSSLIYTRNGDVRIGDYLDNEKDYQTFMSLLENAQGQKNIPTNLRQIIYEELSAYYTGMIDKMELRDRLDKRVRIYLSEIE